MRDHVTHVSEQGEATREKCWFCTAAPQRVFKPFSRHSISVVPVATAEMISMALEILRPRIEAISTEAKRTICQNVLLPLIERSTFEKIIDVVLRIVSELVVTHRDEVCNFCPSKSFTSNREASLLPSKVGRRGKTSVYDEKRLCLRNNKQIADTVTQIMQRAELRSIKSATYQASVIIVLIGRVKAQSEKLQAGACAPIQGSYHFFRCHPL